ncbi:Rv1733c family protein [Williamsia sp. SKLECPSW1]
MDTAPGPRRRGPSTLTVVASELGVWRLHHLTRNPLVRSVDRWESAARLLVAIVIVALLPFAFAAGDAAHASAQNTIAHQRAERHLVAATVLTTPPDDATTVRATWDDGSTHPVPQDIPSLDADHRGTVRPIWVDQTNQPTAPPARPGTAVVQGILIGCVTAAGIVGVGAIALRLLTVMTNRRRFHAWDSEWSMVRLDAR